jgi:hypothetical protein
MLPHGKGNVAVQPSCSHGKGCATAMPIAFAVQYFFAVRRVWSLPSIFLCRALSSVYVVQRFVAVRYLQRLPCKVPLPCVLVPAHSKDLFAVHVLTAKIYCTTTPFFQ